MRNCSQGLQGFHLNSLSGGKTWFQKISSTLKIQSVYLSTCLCIYLSMHTHTNIHTHAHTNMYTDTYTHIYAHILTLSFYIYRCVFFHVQIQISLESHYCLVEEELDFATEDSPLVLAQTCKNTLAKALHLPASCFSCLLLHMIIKGRKLNDCLVLILPSFTFFFFSSQHTPHLKNIFPLSFELI